MTRDYTKPMTILVAGSADSTTANINDNLIEWIFGDQDSRDVTVVPVYRPNLGKGMTNFLVWGNEIFQWDQEDGDPLFAAVAPEGGHRSISHASKTWQAHDYHEAMGWAVGQLTTAREDGNEVAVIMFYNPEDADDLYLIEAAKKLELPTYDLAMSMVDNFPGYQTEEEKAVAAKATEEFEEKTPEEEPKKAPAPRKRAAKKTVASKVSKTLEADEKPLQDVPEPTPVLSADVAIPRKGPNPHRAPLPGNPMYDQAAPSGLVYTPNANEVKTATESMTVNKSDFVSLAEAMKKMGEGFTEAIAALTSIVEGQ